MSKPKVIIYTGGEAKPNPGFGGWGAILIFDDNQKELTGGEAHTTSNRMELTAVINALEYLDASYDIDLYTDSEYLRKGITDRISNGIRGNKRNVTNSDLWQQLHDATQRHTIQCHEVRNYTGIEYNEHANQLATVEIKKLRDELPPTGEISALPNGVVIYLATSIGGWTVYMADRTGKTDISSGEENAPRYKMELVGAISALETITIPSTIEFYTDSESLQKGISHWIQRWLKNNWTTASGQPVKYKDLWIRLHQGALPHQIRWKSHKEAQSLSMDNLLERWWRLK